MYRKLILKLFSASFHIYAIFGQFYLFLWQWNDWIYVRTAFKRFSRSQPNSSGAYFSNIGRCLHGDNTSNWLCKQMKHRLIFKPSGYISRTFLDLRQNQIPDSSIHYRQCLYGNCFLLLGTSPMGKHYA